MNAPLWRLKILASVGALLRTQGFRGSRTRYWKVIGNRRIIVQLVGGSDPHDTAKLSMGVILGVDFIDLERPGDSHLAYVALWWGYLGRSSSQGLRETAWRAYSDSEAVDMIGQIQIALPPALATVEERFQTWHDVLPYMSEDVRDTLNPPGRVCEWKLPKVALDG